MARQTSPKDFPKIHDFGKCEFSFEPEKMEPWLRLTLSLVTEREKSLNYFFSYIVRI